MSTAPPRTAAPDACAACHAPLAPDQRYCLQCGARREGARLEFLEVLAEPAPGTAGRPVPHTIVDATPRRRGWFRDGGLLAVAVALVGVLFAGLLIGHWAGGGSKGPATQIVRVAGAPASTTTAAGAVAITTPAAAPPASPATTDAPPATTAAASPPSTTTVAPNPSDTAANR